VEFLKGTLLPYAGARPEDGRLLGRDAEPDKQDFDLATGPLSQGSTLLAAAADMFPPSAVEVFELLAAASATAAGRKATRVAALAIIPARPTLQRHVAGPSDGRRRFWMRHGVGGVT
jgi:hypothetical protein